MRQSIIETNFDRSWRVVASFGSAHLISSPQGKMELRGGSKSDQLAAREWISLFMHEAVPRIVGKN